MFKFKQKITEEDNESEPKSKYFSAGSVLKDNSQSSVSSCPVASSSSSTVTDSSSQMTTSSEKSVNQLTDNQNGVEEVSDSTFRKPVIFGNTLLVNSNQLKNKLLKHLKIPYQLTDSISPAHYVMFDSCCALFLSLKYHVIYPDYIYDKLNQLKNTYQLKVLLVFVDHIEYQSTLKELTKLSIRTNCTLILSWSYEEAANHIENYRNYADKSADIIMGRQNTNTDGNQTAYESIVEALTSVKSINKTDAVSLISTFDSFENIVKSDDDQLILCPGMAALKAQRLRQVFQKPFIRN